MDHALEILKYLLPALVVFATTFYMVKKYFDGEEKKRKHQLLVNNQSMIMPLRLQAYERMILFLERISPESMIMRVNRQGYTCQQLQTELMNSIRSEFEHNLSQQIYVSAGAWEMLKIARGRTIQLINMVAEKVPNDSPSINLSKGILESIVDQEKAPVADAIAFIKKEIGQLF
ncbi:MAG TPA: hypothetical protein VJ203_03700 [Bacteroidales bacterium]|nr:hypothetical protein [Bacteroidales bacterium]